MEREKTLLDELELIHVSEANARHDREHGNVRDFCATRVRSGWNERQLATGKKLTDKKIKSYAERGYYSDDFRSARKELWTRKAAKKQKRDGNFEVADDGRLIYRP